MKKIAIFVAAAMMSLTTFAQVKGDKYVSGAFSADFGVQKTTYISDYDSESESQPLNTTVGVGVEYGHFVADNWKLALGLGVSYTDSPQSKTVIRWLKDRTMAVLINPNVSYYVPLADKLYYTPEVGASFEFGSIREELGLHENYTVPCKGWSMYANLLALEYRVNDKAALGIVVGSFGYSSASFTIENRYKYRIGQTKFDFNGASIHYRRYF